MVSAYKTSQDYISEQDYLEGELTSETKHEYMDGMVYAMSGAHVNHVRIADNLIWKIKEHLNAKPCQVYGSDLKVKIGTKYFYPDVTVDCTDVDGYYTQHPSIIIEVLSKSTRQYDKTVKRLCYMQIPTLDEYILIEQDFVEIEVFRRCTGWQAEYYYLGDTVDFKVIDLQLGVAEIYDRVKNQDMQDWLAQTQSDE